MMLFCIHLRHPIPLLCLVTFIINYLLLFRQIYWNTLQMKHRQNKIKILLKTFCHNKYFRARFWDKIKNLCNMVAIADMFDLTKPPKKIEKCICLIIPITNYTPSDWNRYVTTCHTHETLTHTKYIYTHTLLSLSLSLSLSFSHTLSLSLSLSLSDTHKHMYTNTPSHTHVYKHIHSHTSIHTQPLFYFACNEGKTQKMFFTLSVSARNVFCRRVGWKIQFDYFTDTLCCHELLFNANVGKIKYQKIRLSLKMRVQK